MGLLATHTYMHERRRIKFWNVGRCLRVQQNISTLVLHCC